MGKKTNDVGVAVGIGDARRDKAAVEPQRRRSNGRGARAAAGHARTEVVGAALRERRGRLGCSLGGRERLGRRRQAVGRVLPHALGVPPLPPRAPLGLGCQAHSLALDDHILQSACTRGGYESKQCVLKSECVWGSGG